MVAFSKDRILQDIQEKLLPGAVVFSLIAAVFGSYSYYKYFFFSYADAIVDSIAPHCVYYKNSRVFPRGGDWERIDCQAKDEAAKLIADGYQFTGPGQTVRVVYEAEPGRKTYAILDGWPSDAGPAKLGMNIRARYSPSTPGRAEPASEPDNSVFVVSGLILVFGIGGHVILKSRRRQEPAEKIAVKRTRSLPT
jgi:hypothetical protein